MGNQAHGEPARYFGLYPAIVTDIVDARRLGRIEVKFPWLGQAGERDVRAWATLLTPYADAGQGLEILPEVGTEVVVAFEAGSPRRPYIVGACWNGVEPLPEEPEAANNKRLIKTRAGSLLEFDDTEGSPKITLSTRSGHKIVLDEGAQQVTIAHANGASIKIDASGKVAITGLSSVDVTAPVMNVHAAVANFDGLVNCTTLVASAAVSSPVVTTAAGNIL